MSISRAQAEALKDGYVDQYGRIPPSGSFPLIDAMLGAAAKGFIDDAQKNLDKAAAVDTGDLSTELRFEVETTGGNYTMSVGYEQGSKASKYYDFTNKGVQGVNKAGHAAGSPYRFRFLGVSKKHAYAIEQWLRRSGKGATNIHPKHPASNLERKRVSARQSIQRNPMQALAYATARASKREGLRATKYFDNAVHSALGPEFIRAMEIALGGEVIVSIRQAQL